MFFFVADYDFREHNFQIIDYLLLNYLLLDLLIVHPSGCRVYLLEIFFCLLPQNSGDPILMIFFI